MWSRLFHYSRAPIYFASCLRIDEANRFILEAYSAGTRPGLSVQPLAIEVMNEKGVDISSHRPKSVDEFLNEDLDYVVTVCDNALEECPIIPGNHAKMHTPFEDPTGFVGTNEERLMQFRKVRDQIATSMNCISRSQLKS